MRRRPLLAVTVLCALLGSASHVVIDGFTHNGRWGAEWLGLDQWVVADLPVRGELTAARGLQYLGHVGGSLIGLALFAQIGRRRLLEPHHRIALTPVQVGRDCESERELIEADHAELPPGVEEDGALAALNGHLIVGSASRRVEREVRREADKSGADRGDNEEGSRGIESANRDEDSQEKQEERGNGGSAVGP